VHDELVFECDEGFVPALREAVTGLMAGAAHLSVPLLVDCGVGDNWEQAH
jgi:DNA polymerase I - 3''-5'' exonuclease and polymerase domains